MAKDKFKKGDIVIVKEDNRVYPEEYELDECDGELGFWDGYIFVPVLSVIGTVKIKRK